MRRCPEGIFPAKAVGVWWIYLIGRRQDVTGGANWVKVGITSSPQSRLRIHRRMGAEWLHLLARGSKTFAYQTERLICERFRVVGRDPHRYNREDFLGIPKLQAIATGRLAAAYIRSELGHGEALDVSRTAETKAWLTFRRGLSARFHHEVG